MRLSASPRRIALVLTALAGSLQLGACSESGSVTGLGADPVFVLGGSPPPGTSGCCTPCPTPIVITSEFNGTSVPKGSTLYFNSVFTASGLASGTVFFDDDTLDVPGLGKFRLPGARITFDPSASVATTSFDPAGFFVTVVPPRTSGSVFLTAVAIPLPSGLPGGIKNVRFTTRFGSHDGSAGVQVKWAAAAYSRLGATADLQIKPVDDNSASLFKNSDHAGTPENFKQYVIGGVRGGGGSNFTGSYSGTASGVCQ